MAYFYEIRSSTNAVLKRDGGFADVEAAKSTARAVHGVIYGMTSSLLELVGLTMWLRVPALHPKRNSSARTPHRLFLH